MRAATDHFSAPSGAHDDQVDALTGAYTTLTQRPDYPIVAPGLIRSDPAHTLGRDDMTNHQR